MGFFLFEYYSVIDKNELKSTNEEQSLNYNDSIEHTFVLKLFDDIFNYRLYVRELYVKLENIY